MWIFNRIVLHLNFKWMKLLLKRIKSAKIFPLKSWISFQYETEAKESFHFFMYSFAKYFWINIPLPSQWMGAHSRQMRPFKCIIRRGPGILGHAASAARTSVTAISWSSWSLACYRSACYGGLGFSHFMFFFFGRGAQAASQPSNSTNIMYIFH